MLSRRRFIAGTAATAVASGAWTRLALAGVSDRRQRFVLVILRGGLDGLAAVAPYGDPDHERARRGLAMEASDGLRDLDAVVAGPDGAALDQRAQQAGRVEPLGEEVLHHAVLRAQHRAVVAQ